MAEVEATQDSSTVVGKVKETEEEEEGDMESQIQRAMRSRVRHFKDQADSLTFEGVRRLLEKDLGLETYALDVHKRFIKECLLEYFNGGDDDNGSKSSKSSAETVEKHVPTSKGEVVESPEKEQMKKDVKEASSEEDENMDDSPVMGLLTGHKKTKVQTQETQVIEKKEVPSESKIKEAIRNRASFLKANSDKITMAGVRRLLEEDLELDKSTLIASRSS